MPLNSPTFIYLVAQTIVGASRLMGQGLAGETRNVV